MTELDKQSLYFVLAELTFPAQRWEILTQADMYGVDGVTRERLRLLPSRSTPYRDMQDIIDALEAASHETMA
ncbi:MAG TPA: hypothetical protein VHZ97_16530 [Pseudonocardiaceae bacterium]|jgi:hypothetical protein|nr:hypothetical protein [Pseudonocardiaceae bacterium]